MSLLRKNLAIAVLLICIASCPVQAGIECDGFDDLITSVTAMSTFATASAWTVTGYVKSTGSTFDSDQCWGGGPFLMDVNGNLAVGRAGLTGTGHACGYNSGGGTDNVTSVTTAGWQHIAVRLSAGALELFVNGVSVSSVGTGNNADLTGTLQLCGGVEGTSPDRIDDVKIYNVAVPNDEIATLGRSRTRYIGRTTPTGYWPLNDCTDGTSVDAATLRDRSGFNRNITGDNGANNTGLTCRASEFVTGRQLRYMKTVITALALLIMAVSLANAEDFICHNAGKFLWYQHAVDPTRTRPCPGAATRVRIQPADIPAQRAIGATLDSGTYIPEKYRKVVAGLMVEMTPAEKAIEDTPTPQEAARAAFKAEMDVQDICSRGSIQNIRQKFDQLRSDLQVMINNINSVAATRAELANILKEIVDNQEKLAICTVGLRKVVNK